ncbi:unnamed protein product [Lymnaea stagnalis]|uniref:Centromere protein N n=1 Tax=Lymnaea stagnalis TaxID=6523 RepID=A0AAV2H7E3_LYMST
MALTQQSKEIVKSVVSRCRNSAIPEIFFRWGRLNNANLNRQSFSGAKHQIISKILKLIQEEACDLNDEIIGELELVYTQLESRSTIWKVYKLTGTDLNLNLDPRTLRSKLQQSLELKWKDGCVYGNMRMFAGGVWLRMHMSLSLAQGNGGKKTGAYQAKNSVFVVTFPGSPYVMVSKAGVKLVKLVTEAISSVMNAASLVDIQLSGKHVASLADIVLRKDSKVSISSTYRDKEEAENPLIEKQPRKRKAPEEEFLDSENIVDEDREEKRLRIETVVNKFGYEPQPVLERLSYSFDIKFHGEEMDTTCKSSVEIRGKSTLEGICQLAKTGLTKFPLPAHIGSITSSCLRNSFTIQNKKK